MSKNTKIGLIAIGCFLIIANIEQFHLQVLGFIIVCLFLVFWFNRSKEDRCNKNYERFFQG